MIHIVNIQNLDYTQHHVTKFYFILANFSNH